MKPDFDSEPGKYTYDEDQYGKHAYGVLKNGAQSKRDQKAQREAGGAERQATDHGGHLIPNAAGGENSARNLDAQAANVNQRSVRHTERKALELAQDKNNRVFYDVQNYHGPGRVRPDAVMLTVSVRNERIGQTDTVHESITNVQSDVLEECDRDLEELEEKEGVEDWYDMLTPEERAQADEIAEEMGDEMDAEIDSLGDWENVSYLENPSGVDGGMDDSAGDGMDGGMDNGMDNGMDDGMDGGME